VATRSFTTALGPVDLARTLFPVRRGHGDPVMRLAGQEAARGLRTADGPATLWLRVRGDRVSARAWGPGAGAALEAAPALIGADDVGAGFHPHGDVVADLWRRYRGVRLTRTGEVMPALFAAILEQKVIGKEARGAWRALVHATSERAPGPADVWLPPEPARVASLSAFDFHRFGVESRRADVVRAVASRAPWFQELTSSPPAEARERMQLHRGIGAWTAAETARMAFGDPDAVSVGDYHLPNLVSWVLAGEPRGDDARMLELLEPYRGHRARVQLLLEAGIGHAPRYGPRLPIRSIAEI
jgi:3-methyladenine DNA glycosylase/8-oxoguanine DNA glycosylase